MKTQEITNSEDVIDSRDVIARIEYLEGERDAAMIESEESRAAFREEHSREPFIAENGEEFLTDMWDDEREAEYQSLRALAEEASSSPDWEYGEMLIRDSYFEDYARGLADDIGAVDCEAKWPNTFIDWTAAANALKQDYTSVSFAGEDYWIRA